MSASEEDLVVGGDEQCSNAGAHPGHVWDSGNGALGWWCDGVESEEDFNDAMRAHGVPEELIGKSGFEVIENAHIDRITVTKHGPQTMRSRVTGRVLESEEYVGRHRKPKPDTVSYHSGFSPEPIRTEEILDD